VCERGGERGERICVEGGRGWRDTERSLRAKKFQYLRHGRITGGGQRTGGARHSGGRLVDSRTGKPSANLSVSLLAHTNPIGTVTCLSIQSLSMRSMVRPPILGSGVNLSPSLSLRAASPRPILCAEWPFGCERSRLSNPAMGYAAKCGARKESGRAKCVGERGTDGRWELSAVLPTKKSRRRREREREAREEAAHL